MYRRNFIAGLLAVSLSFVGCSSDDAENAAIPHDDAKALVAALPALPDTLEELPVYVEGTSETWEKHWRDEHGPEAVEVFATVRQPWLAAGAVSVFEDVYMPRLKQRLYLVHEALGGADGNEEQIHYFCTQESADVFAKYYGYVSEE